MLIPSRVFKKIIITLIVILALISLLNFFFIDWYSVSSNSMAPTISDKSIMITTKGIAKVGESRGYNRLQKNDIVVFQKPTWIKTSLSDNSDYYVKRCIGMPGDVITINRPDLPFRYIQTMPGQQAVMYLFPQDTLFKDWTLTNYGPIWVPKKNTSITLNAHNVRLYKKIILSETPSISIEQDTMNLRGKTLREYTFKFNYYFMLGDNFLQSKDSRMWGCIPENLLLGKVLWYY